MDTEASSAGKFSVRGLALTLKTDLATYIHIYTHTHIYITSGVVKTRGWECDRTGSRTSDMLAERLRTEPMI